MAAEVPDPPNVPRDYFTMWNLVQRNFNASLVKDAAFLGLMSPELLMAIFWEETQFINLRQEIKTGKLFHSNWLKLWTHPGAPAGDGQRPGNHAVGFGQVERDTFWLILKFAAQHLDDLFPGKLGRDIDLKTLDLEILGDENKSVQATWRTLNYLFFMGNRTKSQMLSTYGNKAAADKWIICETVQKAFQRMSPTVTATTFRANLSFLAGAFWIARVDGNFPRAFFGVTQNEAAVIGRQLERIVLGRTGIPSLAPDVLQAMQKFVADVAAGKP